VIQFYGLYLLLMMFYKQAILNKILGHDEVTRHDTSNHKFEIDC